MDYAAAVDAQVERNEGAGGWAKGPEFICDMALEETVDVSAWLRGLEEGPLTPEQRFLIDQITADSSLLFEAVLKLRATYG